ncbi:hypothetical protein EVAR_58731_1 [Eumeta japonica]|uniref:Secreted protein n=1 Tax=Eumeta variegata TaxID=151549 RepID=A0A4C1YVQ6_EUMVA|nr:hypothetical protein EVAR_58731_1 [Eumeta japonica]
MVSHIKQAIGICSFVHIVCAAIQAVPKSESRVGLRSRAGSEPESTNSIRASNVGKTRISDRMRTGKRNRHRRPDSPDPNPKSKRDDISINQLT